MNNLARGCLLPAFLMATYCASAQSAVNLSWNPVTEAERQMREPRVEKDAGVEALFWTVHVEDVFHGVDAQRVLKHYLRLKVFNEKGKEKVSTIDIEFSRNSAIQDVAARTIKPDGTVVELKKDAVFERDLVRTGQAKIRVKSFAVPAVEPGAIVEYRYTELRDHPALLYARFQLQQDYPVEKVTYYVKPLSREVTSYSMGLWPFNCRPSSPKLERDGYSSFSLEDVVGFHEEPIMFSEANARSWVLLVYRQDEKRDPDKYWNEIGKRSYEHLKQATKANDVVKKAAAEVTAGAKNDEERVLALIRYVRQHTRGFSDAGVTDAERNKVKMPKEGSRTAAEVLQSGLGTSDERNLLFAALAGSAGLETRPALLPNRQDILFDPRMTDSYFLDSVDMAVKIGDQWKLYDVSASHLPSGMLSWAEEGVPALLSDPKKPSFITTPLAPPEASQTRRTGRFTLSEEGTLEGDVEELYTGHAAGERRSALEGESEARQQDRVKEQIVAVYPQAEVTGVLIGNVGDSSQPVSVQYHVKLPGYAGRTAKRMLLQPLYFERGAAPLFSAATRRYPVAFRYAFQEVDRVSIKLPSGFTLEHAEAPGGINFGDPGSYSYSVEQSGENELNVNRQLTFGKGGAVFFDASTYPRLKALFDEIYARDTRALSLTPSGGAQ